MAQRIDARIKCKTDTTENWNAVRGTFTPLRGEVIVYSDYLVKPDRTRIPNIKIGTGNAFVGDLPFVDEDTRTKLLAHIADTDVHVTASQKEFWNNKVNIDDTSEVVNGVLDNETLIFTRL